MFFDDIKIRFRYYMDVNKPIFGKFSNSSKFYEPKPDDDKKEYISICKNPGFRNHLKFEFDESFHGL